MLAPVVAALAATGGAGTAAAQSPNPGLFSVTPSRQVVSGRPPKRLPAFTVSNTTKVPLNVRVFGVLLDQELSGQINFSELPRDLDAAAKILDPSPATFRLEPGSRRKVVVTWRLQPSGKRVVDAGVVFQSTAAVTSRSVQTVQRLLTLNFLQLPGHYRSTGRFTLLRAEQGPKRTLHLVPRIKNTGEVVQSPQNGRVIIRDAANDVVFRGRFVGDVILPRHQRDFPVSVRKVLPRGRYAMAATATFGDSGRIHIRSSFTLVGPNQLPTPRIALEDFRGSGVIGGDSQATGIVHSVGTATAGTNVKVQLYRLLANGQRPVKPIAERKLTYTALAPGARRDLRIVYPDLRAGRYRLIATYRDTPDSLKRREVDFSLRERKSSTSVWPIAGGGLLVLLLLLALLAFLLRRRHRDDDGPINVNTASAAELERLPGVGPRAAARIVAHREEYGRIGSLEDLRGIEGFDDERVAGLADAVAF